MDFKICTQLRVLVEERVEAVRAGGDDLLYAVAIECFDVLFSENLEQIFVAEPPGRVSRARLFISQDCEVNVGLLEHACHCPGDFGIAFVQCPGAAHPEQHFGARVGRHGWDIEPFHPVGTGHCCADPRVAALFQALERGLCRGRDSRLLHRKVTAHVHDCVDVVDTDGARFNARCTRGTRPQHVLAHGVRDHGNLRLRRGFAVRHVQQVAPAHDHITLEVLDDLAW